MTNIKKTDKPTPQQKLLDKLTTERNNLDNSWKRAKAKIAETKEALENLQSTKSQLEGQHSAVARNIQSLVAEFEDLELPEDMGRMVKASSKKKKDVKKSKDKK